VQRRNASTGPPKAFGDRTKSGGFHTQKMMPVSLVAQPLLAGEKRAHRHLSAPPIAPAARRIYVVILSEASTPGFLGSRAARLPVDAQSKNPSALLPVRAAAATPGCSSASCSSGRPTTCVGRPEALSSWLCAPHHVVIPRSPWRPRNLHFSSVALTRQTALLQHRLGRHRAASPAFVFVDELLKVRFHHTLVCFAGPLLC
jgi:hypothetical protein